MTTYSRVKFPHTHQLSLCECLCWTLYRIARFSTVNIQNSVECKQCSTFKFLKPPFTQEWRSFRDRWAMQKMARSIKERPMIGQISQWSLNNLLIISQWSPRSPQFPQSFDLFQNNRSMIAEGSDLSTISQRMLKECSMILLISQRSLNDLSCLAPVFLRMCAPHGWLPVPSVCTFCLFVVLLRPRNI